MGKAVRRGSGALRILSGLNSKAEDCLDPRIAVVPLAMGLHTQALAKGWLAAVVHVRFQGSGSGRRFPVGKPSFHSRHMQTRTGLNIWINSGSHQVHSALVVTLVTIEQNLEGENRLI